MRLPHEVAPLFRAWLDEHYPDRAAKVMATIRSMRGGTRQRSRISSRRMRGQGVVGANCLRTRFDKAATRYGLGTMPSSRCARDLFEPPPGDQLRLL